MRIEGDYYSSVRIPSLSNTQVSIHQPLPPPPASHGDRGPARPCILLPTTNPTHILLSLKSKRPMLLYPSIPLASPSASNRVPSSFPNQPTNHPVFPPQPPLQVYVVCIMYVCSPSPPIKKPNAIHPPVSSQKSECSSPGPFPPPRAMSRSRTVFGGRERRGIKKRLSFAPPRC